MMTHGNNSHNPTDPSKSAYEAFAKKWDFKAVPMAPLGAPIIERASWTAHGPEGFCIGFAKGASNVDSNKCNANSDTIAWPADAIQQPGCTYLEILDHNISRLENVLNQVSNELQDIELDDYYALQDIYYPEHPVDTNDPASPLPTDTSGTPDQQAWSSEGVEETSDLTEICQTSTPTIWSSEGGIIQPVQRQSSTVNAQPSHTYNTRNRIVMAAALMGVLYGAFKDASGKNVSYNRAKVIDNIRWQAVGGQEQMRLVEELESWNIYHIPPFLHASDQRILIKYASKREQQRECEER